MNVYDSILQEVAEKKAILAKQEQQRIEEQNQRELTVRREVYNYINSEEFKALVVSKILSKLESSKDIFLFAEDLKIITNTREEALVVIQVLREHGFTVVQWWFENYRSWSVTIRVKDC